MDSVCNRRIVDSVPTIRRLCGLASMSTTAWAIGQIATVLFVTVFAGAASAQEESFSDDFESPTLDPRWTPFYSSGFITDPINHVLQLNTFDTSGVNKAAGVRHFFKGPTYGRLSVWLYDTGADAPSSNYLTLWAPPFGIGTWDYDLGGGTYHWTAGTQDGDSAVDRTPGWHHLVIDSSPNSSRIEVDDTVVFTGPGGQPFLEDVQLEMHAPYWRPAWVSYWDDFEFVPAETTTIEIESVVVLDAFGDIADSTSDDGELSFYSRDQLMCNAIVTNPGDLGIQWKIIPADGSGDHAPLGFPGSTSLQFTLENVPPWEHPDSARSPRLEFTLVAQLCRQDNGTIPGDVVAESKPFHIAQDDRGRLRQEYEDDTRAGKKKGTKGKLRVPAIAEFVWQEREADGVGENTGDYNWAILDWGRAAADRVDDAVQQNTETGDQKIRESVPLQRNCIYRNPVHNFIVEGDAESKHMYGEAVDFQVLDWAAPYNWRLPWDGKTDRSGDWKLLQRICEKIKDPAYELESAKQVGNYGHVHIEIKN